MRDWLKTIRIDSKLTQAALSERVGIDITAIGKYESGERRPSVETAKKIAAELNFDWTRFYEDGDPAQPPEEAAL